MIIAQWCCCGTAEDIVIPEKPVRLQRQTTSFSNGDIVKNLYYKTEGTLELGDVYRFVITYSPEKDDSILQEDDHGKFLSIKVKNEENNLLRTVYLTGPFAFYVDITPYNYKNNELFDEKIQYNSDIKPGSAFKGKLYINKNSQVKEGLYSWTVDAVSQMTLTVGSSIKLVVLIGPDYKLLKKALLQEDVDGKPGVLSITKLDTKALINHPPKHKDKPVHLVVTTHGIFANIGADLLYLRDQIQKKLDDNPNSNVIIRGFPGNAGKSEKGIRYLGKRVGDYVLDLYDSSVYDIDRISFIGHSLGGPVQAYAISHIVSVRPDFFRKVIPINFIMLASPMLGVLSEFPKAVSFALDLGFLGKTGRDLVLSHKFPTIYKAQKTSTSGEEKEKTRLSLKPILEQILRKQVHVVYEMFSRRTTYANAINDGIVPLGTSSLLYLDWKSLGQVSFLKKNKNQGQERNDHRIETIAEGSGESNVSESTLSEVAAPDLSEDRGPPASHSGNTSEEVHSKTPTEKRPPNSPLSENPVFKGISSTLSSIETATSSPLTSLKKKTQTKKHKKYLRTQTIRSLSSESSTTNSSPVESPISPTSDGNGKVEIVSSELENNEDPDADMNIPPVASTVISAAVAMLAPAPEPEYLIDPASRPSTIFHDRVYKFSDLPNAHYPKNQLSDVDSTNVGNVFTYKAKKELQERLARSWHSGMDWRKVLATLKPDAHNNIIVRRKFVNAWGWEVIEHLVDNHFSEDSIRKDDEYVAEMRSKFQENQDQ